MVVLKKYRNVGTSPIVASKRLRIEVGETTDFIAMDPGKEKFALGIGALEIVEEKNANVEQPEFASDSNPTAPAVLTEDELREASKKTTKKSR